MLNRRVSLASISNSAIVEINHVVETKRKLKRELTDLGIRTTAHGINRILNRTYIVKIIWFACFFLALGLCAYTIITNIKLYLSFRVNTLVQVVPQNEIAIPAVSICNLNPLITEQGFKYVSDYYLDNYQIRLDNYTQFYDLVDRRAVPNEIDWLLYKTYDSEFNTTLRMSFGFDSKSTIIYCAFYFFLCEPEYTRPFYHPKYGNCFVFNSGVNENGEAMKLLTSSNAEYGIEMSIFSGISDTEKSYLYENFDKGAVVIIDDQETMSIEKEGILLKTGYFTNIILSVTNTENLPAPYNDCYDNETVNTVLSNQMKQINMSYDRRNCFTLCRQKKIIDTLGCYDMRYPRLFNANPCNNQSVFRLLKSIEFDLNECQKMCPLECKTMSYNWMITYAEYPSYRQFKYLNKTSYDSIKDYFSSYSYSNLKKSVAHFFIYFDPMTITQIEQSPSILFTDLIANIGGALGLFIGISVLSFIELVEMTAYIVEAILKIIKRSPIEDADIKDNTEINSSKECEEISLWSDIIKELKRRGYWSTIDGIQHLVLTERLYIRIIWIIFIFISLGLCFWMIANNIISYLKYETQSIIRKKPNDNLTFPTLSLCDSNYFKTREASNYLRAYFYNSSGVNITNLDEFNDFAGENSDTILAWKFYETFSPDFNMTLRRSFGYPLQDTLIKCEFYSQPCNLSWFDWYYHPWFGNCYKFNSGRLNGVSGAIELLSVDKPNVGLYMELFTGLPDDYYNFYFFESTANALYMHLNDHDHFPLDKYGSPFKPGLATQIGLSLTHYSNLPAPYSSCQYPDKIDTPIVRLMYEANMTYDRYNCIELCIQLLCYNKSGCYAMNLPNIANLPLCSSYEAYQTNYVSKVDDTVCPEMCPPECEQSLYMFKSEISFSDFPSRNYASKLIEDQPERYARLFGTSNITYDMFRKSITSVFFYFEDLAITNISESPSMLLVDLIANIGGYLGLFAGISVLTAVEIIELAFNLLAIILEYRQYKLAEKKSNSQILY